MNDLVEWFLIFLKSTFMWWKSSRSRLVADDVINEQISLELWQTDYIHMNALVRVWINSTWQRLSTSSEAVGFNYSY